MTILKKSTTNERKKSQPEEKRQKKTFFYTPENIIKSIQTDKNKNRKMLRSANFYNFSAKTPKIFNFLLIFLHFTLLRKQNTRPENTTSERETPQKEKKIFLPLHQTNDFVKNCKHEFLHATHGFQPDFTIL